MANWLVAIRDWLNPQQQLQVEQSRERVAENSETLLHQAIASNHRTSELLGNLLKQMRERGMVPPEHN